MKINPDKITQDLGLYSFGAKGWLKNDSIACPWCGREGKFGFIFKGNGGVAHCFFCDAKKPVWQYLKDIDRRDLLIYEREHSIKNKLKPLTDLRKRQETKELTEVRLPRDLKYLKNDLYLNRRGFTKQHYELFKPSKTESFLEKKLKNYTIFQIFNKGKLVSWLARSKKDYNWHKENLRQFKAGEISHVSLRYMNSEGTDFNLILGGLDEITDKTTTVIVVEGMFDKVGVDNRLRLNEGEEVKCVFTFGNSFTDNQINLLKSKKSVKLVVLMYDYGTVKQSKGCGLKLSQIWETKIAHLTDPEKDPGDMNVKEFNKVLSNLYTPINYYTKFLK